MKQSFLIIFTGLIFCSTAQSQVNYRSTSVKFGYFNPKDIPGSCMLGGNYTIRLTPFDEIGVAVDYFRYHRNYNSTLDSKTNIDLITETEVQINAETNIHIFPLQAILIHRFQVMKYHFWYLAGTLGYELLYYKKNVYSPEKSSESNQYSGMSWSLGIGFIYRMAINYAMVAELFYNVGNVSRDKHVDGPPVKYYVNLSGISVRLGIRFGIF